MTKRRRIRCCPEPLIQVFAPNTGTHEQGVVMMHTNADVAAQKSASKTSLVIASTLLEHYVQRLIGRV